MIPAAASFSMALSKVDPLSSMKSTLPPLVRPQASDQEGGHHSPGHMVVGTEPVVDGRVATLGDPGGGEFLDCSFENRDVIVPEPSVDPGGVAVGVEEQLGHPGAGTVDVGTEGHVAETRVEDVGSVSRRVHQHVVHPGAVCLRIAPHCDVLAPGKGAVGEDVVSCRGRHVLETVVTHPFGVVPDPRNDVGGHGHGSGTCRGSGLVDGFEEADLVCAWRLSQRW